MGLRRKTPATRQSSRLAHAPRTRLGAGSVPAPSQRQFPGLLFFLLQGGFDNTRLPIRFPTQALFLLDFASPPPPPGKPAELRFQPSADHRRAVSQKHLDALETKVRDRSSHSNRFKSPPASFEPVDRPVILLARWEPRGLAPLVRRRLSPFFGKCWLPFGLDFADRPAALTGKNIYV
jgi:hypothetical protein